MAIHNIRINLSDEEESFIKWLCKYDREYDAIRYTPNEELRMLLNIQLKESMDFFREEREAWEKKHK